jgi:hypothetical protein
MTSEIDFNLLPQNMPSVLCIPRVSKNINETRIRNIFDNLNMGTIERIDIVINKNDKDKNNNKVFIHYREWNDSENAMIARERLLQGKEIKTLNDELGFWKISAYREGERKANKKTS